MKWTRVNTKATSYKFPAGDYYVGDLCYVLKEEDDKTNSLYDTVVYQEGFYTNGKNVIGVYHTGDDGAWEDTKGRIYGVDAGNIGIISLEFCDPKSHFSKKKITIKNEFEFGWNGRKIYLKDPVNSENSFEIDLDKVDSEDEEEEW